MTIEDCLEILLGFNSNYNHSYTVKKEDAGVLLSLAKQIGKGTPLTDRQYGMLLKKLQAYDMVFDNLDIDFSSAVSNLRYPLREIDRSKYIKLVDGRIVIRFPFAKKLIVLIDEIAQTLPPSSHFHKKGTHIHEFTLSEQAVYLVIEKFAQKDFEIDKELLDLYSVITTMLENASDYVPGIYDFELRNCHPVAEKYMLETLGEPTPENIHLYKDRAHALGLVYFEADNLNRAVTKCSPLTQSIIKRKKASVFINSTKYSVDSVINSLFELNRFPLAVIVDEFRHSDLDAIENFYNIHKAVSNLVDSKEISVLFRLDNVNDDNVEFNQFVKNNNLNNVVDETTKIVYIKDRAPKFLIKDGWQPSACISCSTNVRLVARKNNYVGDVDLTVHYAKELGIMAEYFNGRDKFSEGIDKL